MNGFINLLKPAGMTSSDVVLCVKRLLPKGTSVGHGGTLDPDAAGVLPICVGKATRLFDYIIDKQKTYLGEIRLGICTDTDDASGRVIEVKPVHATPKDLEGVFPRFTGRIQQVPPMYSALKREGEPLYKKARKGETIELEPRDVDVYSLKLVRQTAPEKYLIEIRCGKGVYIRSLMRDIGAALGCGAHMAFLLRSEAGAFDVNAAISPEELQLSGVSAHLQPMDALLAAYPAVCAPCELRRRVINGQELPPEALNAAAPASGSCVRLYVGSEFAGMGIVTERGGVKIRVMLLEV